MKNLANSRMPFDKFLFEVQYFLRGAIKLFHKYVD